MIAECFISYLLISGNGYFVFSFFTESEADVAQIVETNDTDDKAPSSEHLNDKLAEEVEKEEAENISATEETVSESASAEQREEPLIKAE